MSNDLFARCMAISMPHFLNTPYKEQTITEMYAPDGFANKASGICHYCSVAILKEIINNGCLRFSDIRFLNDSTEFIEIIPLIENVLSCNEYTSDFRKLILESVEMEELKKYHQSYTGFSRIAHKYEQKIYRTYTCSFSTENDSLSMWNYYASSGEGVSIAFNHSWDMFEGSDKSEVNIGEKLKNDIMIYRGLIVYKREDKKKCVMELLNVLQQIYNEAKDEINKYRGHILFAFKESINHMRCFFKNESFACENEYRIVLKIPEELLLEEECSGDIFRKGQFKRGNILIPFVDYKFKRDSIKHIVTNPFIREENSMFELGIRELMWQNKMEDVHIFSSGIPIRKYS